MSAIVERACEEPTLADALSWIAVWENDRVVRQALRNEKSGERGVDGSQWDTCFKWLFEQVLNKYSYRATHT